MEFRLRSPVRIRAVSVRSSLKIRQSPLPGQSGVQLLVFQAELVTQTRNP
jgi:hypothetical protein